MNRKQLAKKIDRQFLARFSVWEVLEIIAFSVFVAFATLAGNNPDLMALYIASAIVAFVLFIVAGFRGQRLLLASDLMASRALIGFDVSNDPVNEGLSRIKTIGGYWHFHKENRSYSLIMYRAASGFSSAKSALRCIPQLAFLANLIDSIVRRAFRESTKMLTNYQLASYECVDRNMFYDLLTLFIQDGKQFIKRIIRSEVSSFVFSRLCYVVCVALFIACAITHSATYGVAAILFVIFGLFISLVIARMHKFDIMEEYVNYVQSHQVNIELRAKLVNVLEAGDSVIDIANLLRPTPSYGMNQAVNGTGNFQNKYF